MLNARIVKHSLDFKVPGKTSRGVLTQKECYFIVLHDTVSNQSGIGECSTLPDLSLDHIPEYHSKLMEVCQQINGGRDPLAIDLADFPSIVFGLEMALADLSAKSKDQHILFPSDFTEGKKGIPINGLVWMGTREYMEQQINEKLAQGFDTIKIKVGALDLATELDILRNLRKQFSSDTITIRLDANGAFDTDKALGILGQFAPFDIHSIEQPIRQGQPEAMASLCRDSPIPIALDEELIGRFSLTEKEELLRFINPAYLILKPSLIGGFKASESWIALAEKQQIGWWVTSALESNIGLNAIAQWTYLLNNPLPQGLGTGQVYTNNIQSPLTISKGKLFYDHAQSWDLNLFQ
jgi:o-succinylbenzoate synthase